MTFGVWQILLILMVIGLIWVIVWGISALVRSRSPDKGQVDLYKTSTGKYVGVWILWSIIVTAISSGISETINVSWYEKNLWVEPIYVYVISTITAVGIYSYFTSLDKSRVVPWFYGLGILGVLLAIGKNKTHLDALSDLEYEVTSWYVSMVVCSAASMFFFHWFFVIRVGSAKTLHEHSSPNISPTGKTIYANEWEKKETEQAAAANKKQKDPSFTQKAKTQDPKTTVKMDANVDWISIDPAKAISIQIGVAVAMSDGSFDDLKGEAIKAWIKRAVKPYSGKKLEELKNLYNTAFKDAYEAALQNKLTLSELTSRLNRIGDKAVKYDAVALCYDVMKADGEIAPEEIQTIHKVGEVLKLDMKELEKLRDKSIVGFEGKISAESGSFESMIGIKPDWSKDRIHAHLNEQFMKWNNRLNALPEGEERENAQAMLDRIAEYRKSHGGNT